MSKPKKSLRVGEIFGQNPQRDPDETALLRISLALGAPAEPVVREQLYRTPAIDVVDDPLGIFHEAVPYETLLVTSGSTLVDGLKQTLRRYFTPLCHRRLSFELHQTGLSAQSSVYFGDLIEAGWGTPRGAIRVRTGQAPFGAPLAEQAVQASGDWWAGHSAGVFLLGQNPDWEGLPVVDVGLPDLVLVVQGANTGPTARLRQLIRPSTTGEAHPILGTVEAEAEFTRRGDFEMFYASFPSQDIHVEITPDSAFSRVTPEPRARIDALEIIGVYLPYPGRGDRILGLSLNLTEANMLRVHGLLPQKYAIDLLTDSEAHLRWIDGRSFRIPRGSNQVVPTLGHTIRPPDEEDQIDRNRFSLLTAIGQAGMGWIPLRLGNPAVDEGHVEASDLHYARSERLRSDGMSSAEAAIQLDWLNTACQLVVRDDDNSTLKIGLAEFILREGWIPPGQLRLGNGMLSYSEGTMTRNDLRHNSVFRIGPLRVRLVKAGHGS